MRTTKILFASVATAILLTACGGDDAATSDAADPVDRGRALVESRGCVACHGSDGQGGIGPPWVDLAGSEVELEDGSVVVADTEYLRRAVLDPGAEVVAGTDVAMPENDLSPEQADDVVAYIESLSTNGSQP